MYDWLFPVVFSVLTASLYNVPSGGIKPRVFPLCSVLLHLANKPYQHTFNQVVCSDINIQPMLSGISKLADSCGFPLPKRQRSALKRAPANNVYLLLQRWSQEALNLIAIGSGLVKDIARIVERKLSLLLSLPSCA